MVCLVKMTPLRFCDERRASRLKTIKTTRIFSLPGVLALLVGLLLTACGDPTATTVPATTAASTTKATTVAAATTAAVAGSATTAAATGAGANAAAGPNPCPDPVPAPAKAAPPEAARSGTEKPATLRIGLIPNQNPESQKQQYATFKTYMEKEMAQPIELFVANDYAGVVQAMVADKIDLAYFGGLTYVQAKEQTELYPIVTEIDRFTNGPTYCSAIVVPADSPIKTVAELKGKSFAFGDISSTSGSLFPRIMLEQAGIKVPTDLKEVKYTGGHDATALAVQNGAVDGGGLEERVMLRLIDQGKLDKSKVRVIQRIAVTGYPWAVRAKLDPALVDKITNVFVNIKDQDLLKLLRAESYVKIKDADYEYVREQGLKFGLLTPKK